MKQTNTDSEKLRRQSNDLLPRIMATIIIVVIVHIILAHSNLREVEVNGPIYRKVVQNGELIADILPPPIYIIEPYSLALEMLQDQDRTHFATFETKFQQLQVSLAERQRYWAQKYKDNPPLHSALDKSFKSALAFDALMETQFLPLIEKRQYEKARLLANGEMQAAYTQHRADINELVVLARNENDREQRHAAKLITERTWIQIFWETITILLVVIPAIWLYRSESRLHSTETHLRAIFDHGSDLIFGLSVSEEGSFRYTMINPAGARLGSIDAAKFIGSTPSQYFPPPKAARFEAHYRECLEVGKTIRYEQAAKTPQGAIVFDTTLVPAKNREGRIVQITGISRNITAQKSTLDAMQRLNAQLEQQVAERTREMETAYKELEMFSYSVSHDLRSPLRGINGFCSILIEDHGAKLDPEAREHIARIHAASRRMAQITDDLLQLAFVSQGTLSLQPVDLSALAARIADNLRNSAPQRSVTFVIAPGLAASCDYQLIQSVLENLLGNAWKYTGHHATARIEFDTVEVEGSRAFRVKDDGAGFDMRFVGKLFQNFQRLHDRTEFEGTGIGLAIVARIIRRHGGRVWAEGAVEEGSSFYFTLASPLEHSKSHVESASAGHS